MQKFIALAVLIILMGLTGMRYLQARQGHAGGKDPSPNKPVTVYDVRLGRYKNVPRINKSDEEWRKQLTKQQYHIAFEAGTERPFTGKLNKNKRTGIYRSAVSGNDLFHSDHKYESGTGWPSFYKPVADTNILLREDNTLFMKRVEVVDAVSGAHLGHVFDDGPPPTGKRYCINSAALTFIEGVPFKEPPSQD